MRNPLSGVAYSNPGSVRPCNPVSGQRDEHADSVSSDWTGLARPDKKGSVRAQEIE